MRTFKHKFSVGLVITLVLLVFSFVFNFALPVITLAATTPSLGNYFLLMPKVFL